MRKHNILLQITQFLARVELVPFGIELFKYCFSLPSPENPTSQSFFGDTLNTFAFLNFALGEWNDRVFPKDV